MFLLAVGMFLPIWHNNANDSSPNWIDTNSGNNIEADGPGVYILILAAVALFLLAMNRPEYTWVTTLLAFLPLFIIFANAWSLALNDTGTSLGSSWLAVLGGLILMSAPFWPESLKTYAGRLETGSDGEASEEHSESTQEEEA